MVTGEVTPDGEVVVRISVAGQVWRAVIDPGFNGHVELPEALFRQLRPLFHTQALVELAAGQEIVEDIFIVDFPFDGHIIAADATFVDGADILIGTALLRDYRLDINFVTQSVTLERVAGR